MSKTSPKDTAQSYGRYLFIAGLGALGWTYMTWFRVHNLITEHVSEHGSLPSDESSLASLYLSGSNPERVLSNQLSGMAGLYPYGLKWPLVMATSITLLGTVLYLRSRWAVFAVAFCTAVVSLLFGSHLHETAALALNILE